MVAGPGWLSVSALTLGARRAVRATEEQRRRVHCARRQLLLAALPRPAATTRSGVDDRRRASADTDGLRSVIHPAHILVPRSGCYQTLDSPDSRLYLAAALVCHKKSPGLQPRAMLVAIPFGQRAVSRERLWKLDGLDVRLGTQSQRLDERNMMPAGSDIVVMHREADVVDATSLEGLVIIVGQAERTG